MSRKAIGFNTKINIFELNFFKGEHFVRIVMLAGKTVLTGSYILLKEALLLTLHAPNVPDIIKLLSQ